MPITGQLIHEDTSQPRCWWCGDDPLYIAYHDREWGIPLADDQRLFEKLSLEGFQAGLSWLTILRKRENFREAFDLFELEKVARYSSRKVTQLLQNAGIVRHRGKIESVINNAQRAIELIESEGGLGRYLWQFEPREPDETLRSMCSESKQLSRALKKRGWTFVGPTTLYSLMQSAGMVNDHVLGCHRTAKIDIVRGRFRRP